ncbi:MAG: hypothetical protein KAS32_02585 [Candidatus Peribacteraceae bacterium]|nr:hypothetical protein [Candidatus Peribacteraceae bacterium]
MREDLRSLRSRGVDINSYKKHKLLINYLHIKPAVPNLLRTMALHAHKRGEESNDSLQQRFKRQMQRTGILKMLRERSTHKKKDNKRLVRGKALKREEYRVKNRRKQFYSNM